MSNWDSARQPLGAGSLHDAVTKVLDAADIPDRHGFATVVDTGGAHVALATRLGGGWRLELDADYRWKGEHRGADGQLVIGKTW